MLVGGSWVLHRFATDYEEAVTRWEAKGLSEDGRTITIEYTTSQCNYDQFDRVERVETSSTVELTVILRHRLERGDCEDVAVYHTSQVKLDRPLGDRRLIDGRTGSRPSFDAQTTGEVRIRQVVDVSDGSYGGQFLSEIRLYEEPTGGEVAELRLPDAADTSGSVLVSSRAIRVRPDNYQLVSFQRPCRESCASVDPPFDRCAASISPNPFGPVTVTVSVRPGRGCAIEVG